jgi:hypothetical protein
VDLYERLRQETITAQQDADLPDFLALRIFAIVEHAHGYPLEAIRELIDQVCLYDTYAQTGYMGMGVNNAVLEGSIRRLEECNKNLSQKN